MPRNLIESAAFTRMLAELGDVKRLDDVLRGVCWSIHINAEDWPVVRGFKRVRIAKSDGYGDTPKLRLWFRVLNNDEAELHAIEPEPCLENGEDDEA